VSIEENQSIDDCSRESDIVDWLATTQSCSTVCSAENKAVFFSPSEAIPQVSSNPGIRRGNSDVITTKVNRRHFALPHNKPAVVKGDFLMHRYVVNDYILLQKIGAGAHSEVRLSKNKVTNELFAVKILNKKRHLAERIQREVEIMKKLSHPNVARLYEVLDDVRVEKVYLVLEFLQGGDLMTIVERYGHYNDVQLRSIANQIMCGLNHLHENNVLQNDLKPSNILISGGGIIKIADFGISTVCRIRRADQSGTPAYMAPEVSERDAICFDGRRADIYSLGATCFYLRFGHHPFIGRGIADLYQQIKTAKLSFPVGVDIDLQDLITRLMEKDPLLRLSLKDAMSHPWIRFKNQYQININT
jgi:[calcium/calmodulin-dependent protein kinase] kinase